MWAYEHNKQKKGFPYKFTLHWGTVLSYYIINRKELNYGEN